jgi:phage-related protein
MSEMGKKSKPLVWLHGEIKTPPFTKEGRIEAGTLLRRLQEGENLSLPHSRPMPSVGKRCHELRVPDGEKNWRIHYRVETNAILILEVVAKTTRKTPDHVIKACQRRLAIYDAAVRNVNKDKGK